MKMPGSAPGGFNERERKEIIVNAKSLNELCDALIMIWPLKKGLFRDTANVSETVKLLIGIYCGEMGYTLKNIDKFYRNNYSVHKVLTRLMEE